MNCARTSVTRHSVARSLHTLLPSRSLQHATCTRARPDEFGVDLINESCPVPKDQQPLFELKQLQEQELFKWAELPFPDFVKRLLYVYCGFFAFIGVPVSAATFNFSHEPLQFVVAASIGSWFVVTVTLLRLYLGWSFVGNRLLSATVEYEETGWYDGQVWVKSPQVLMRDRLLSNYTVRPVIDRLKTSLVSCGAAAVLSSFLLAASPVPSVSDVPPKAYNPSRAVAAKSATSDEYWDNVQKYEPWGLEDDAAAKPSSIMDHMTVS